MPPSDLQNARVGLLAGGGLLPICIADACKRNGTPIFVIALEGHADPHAFADDMAPQVVRLGAAGRSLKLLRQHKCTHILLAGSVRRPALAELRPDWWAMKFFAKSGAASLGDDGLLSALTTALEGEGFSVIGPDELVPDLLMPTGDLGRVSSVDAQADIGIGMEAARALGSRDIGQAVVVHNGTVIAEEGPDGTDAMLDRLTTAGNHGGVLVKTMKPGQERRADLPAVGPETVRNADRAGLRGVAIEAGNAFLLAREEAVLAADQAELFLTGVGNSR